MPNQNPEPQDDMMQQPMPQDGSQMPDDPNSMFGQQMPDGDMPNDGGRNESDYDTNFDAGVEADEDEDPKKYIQQLTGKLSQELNKFNNENDNDDELSKYVGKMIIRAAAKALDDKGKKDLIKAVNTTDTDDDDTDIDLDDESASDNDGNDAQETNNGAEQDNLFGDEQMNECASFTKKELSNIFEEFNMSMNGSENDEEKLAEREKNSNKKGKKSIWRGKNY